MCPQKYVGVYWCLVVITELSPTDPPCQWAQSVRVQLICSVTKRRGGSRWKHVQQVVLLPVSSLEKIQNDFRPKNAKASELITFLEVRNFWQLRKLEFAPMEKIHHLSKPPCAFWVFSTPSRKWAKVVKDLLDFFPFSAVHFYFSFQKQNFSTIFQKLSRH